MRGRTNVRLTAGLVTLALCCSELASYIPALAVGNDDEYSVDHEIVTSWDGGYQADITLNNLSDKDMTDWLISFTISAEITDSWGGAFVLSDSVEYEDESRENPESNEIQDESVDDESETQEGGSVSYTYTVTAGDYNTVIPTGGSVTLGYVANGDACDVTDIEVDYTLTVDDSDDYKNDDENEDENLSDNSDNDSASDESNNTNSDAQDSSEPSGTLYVSDGYTVEVQIPQTWEHAYNARLIVTNTSDETLHNWGFLLKTDDDISGLYNAAELSNHDGTRLFKNVGYNQDIPAGGTVEIGYTAYYGSSFDVPSEFALASFEKSVEIPEYGIETFVTDEWDEGALAEIVIKNISDKAIEDWKLEFDSDMNISRVWDVVMVSHDGEHYVLRNADYAQNIASGDTWTIGMEINGSISDIENVIITKIVVTDESVSENKLEQSSVSENSVSQNAVSFSVYIDTEDFVKTYNGDYCIDTVVKSINGRCSADEGINLLAVREEDAFGETVWSGEIESDDNYLNWTINDVGFILGGNKLIFSAEMNDGNIYEDTLIIINKDSENMKNTNVQLVDTDFDGIYDYYEKYFSTDPLEADTDGDKLDDYSEIFILFLNPIKQDSNNNGILDPDDDNDGDGLNVSKELSIGTSDWSEDCDGDGLTDGYEVNVSITDPLNYDTDGDGYSDGTEILLNMNPNSTDSDDDGIADGDEFILQSESYQLDANVIENVEVCLNCKGNISDNMYIYENKSTVINETAGIIGIPINIDVFAIFDYAQITFTYNEEMLGDTDENNLCMMWYKEDTDEYIMLDESVVDVDNNTVSCVTTHFSTYFLVDKWVWQAMSGEPIDYMTYDYNIKENYDFIVFIDYTVSETDLIREQLIATSIIDQMEDGDRLLFLYLKSNSIYREGSGNMIWSTTKSEALSHMDPNSALSLFYGTSLYPTGRYDGCAEQAFKAAAFVANGNNKEMAYLIYPGDKYETKFSNNISLISSNAQILKSGGDIFNAISLSESVSNTLNTYTSMTGGKQYSGSNDDIRNSISEDLAVRLEMSDPYLDTTDSDGDGLYDVYEIRGMRTPNGKVIYTDPNEKDSDGDGISDGVEMFNTNELNLNEVKMKQPDEDGIFHWVSNPNSYDDMEFVPNMGKDFIYVDNLDYIPILESQEFNINEKAVKYANEFEIDMKGNIIYGLDNVYGSNLFELTDEERLSIITRISVEMNTLVRISPNAFNCLNKYMGNSDDKYVYEISLYNCRNEKVMNSSAVDIYQTAMAAFNADLSDGSKVIAMSPTKAGCGACFDFVDISYFYAFHVADTRTIAEISEDGENYYLKVRY